MTRGEVGTRTGGKGSWRRKAKKAKAGGNQEGEKIWAVANRLGCREFGELDTASIIFEKAEDALAFSKPELAIDMRSNTYVLKGTPEKKPIVEVLTDLITKMDLSKFAKGSEENKEDDLGVDTDNVDFANADGETKPDEEKKSE